MKNFNTILAVGAMAVACGAAEAGVVFTGTYTFPTVVSGSQTAFAPMAYNGTPISNVTANSIAITGATWSSSNGNFRGSGWGTGATNASDVFTGSIDLNKYFSFSISAASGYTLDMSSISFGLGRSSTGSRQWQWRSSVDGFASALTNYTTLASGLTNVSGVLQNPDTNSSWIGNTLTLSGASFSGLASVEFRLYAYNAEASTGTAGLQGALSFTGSVSAVPAPGAVALLGVAGLVSTRRRR